LIILKTFLKNFFLREFKKFRKRIIFMEKSEKEKIVNEVLKEIIEPETGKSIIDSGMVKKVEVKDSKVKIELIPISSHCAFCWVMNALILEIEEKLKEKGFEVKVEFVLE